MLPYRELDVRGGSTTPARRASTRGDWGDTRATGDRVLAAGLPCGSRTCFVRAHSRTGSNVMTSEKLRPEDLGFGRLFERIRDAVIVADARTQRIILWNAAAAKMFGYSASEALELRVEALVPEPLKAAHRAGIARYAETGHGSYIDSDALLDLPAVRKNDEEIRVEISLSPIRQGHETDGGEPGFVLAIIRD